MDLPNFLADTLDGTFNMLQMTLNDMSDADLMTRPVPGANTPIWQLGHLIAAEAGMIGELKPGVMPALPAGFKERFTSNTVKIDDQKQLATKAELMDLFTRVRAATVKIVRSLSIQQLETPTSEKMRRMVPNTASLVNLQVGHMMMHLGQIQVLRRKLGKPILF